MEDLEKKTLVELKKLAIESGVTGISKKTKPQLIEAIKAKLQINPLFEPEGEKNPELNSKENSSSNNEDIRARKKGKNSKQSNSVEKNSNSNNKNNDANGELKSNAVQNPKRSTYVKPNTPIPSPDKTLNTSSESPKDTNVSNTNKVINNSQQNSLAGSNGSGMNGNMVNNSNGLNNGQNSGSNTQGSNGNKDNQRYQNDPTVEVSGILEVMSDGTHGVLRSPKLILSDKDTYISISQVKKFKLRKGDYITGTARLPKENERYFSLLWIKSVNDKQVEALMNRPNFDDLKPVYPNKQIKLESGQFPVSNRILDMLAPIGFGQRAMVVAPPKAGKTTLLKEIAKGINENYPDVTLMVVLIGERPEEVTDIERSVKGIVYASNFDDSPANQVAVAELSLERAKRMVELGQDVIILMDSLTRLARAYNVALPASGRTLSGGLDPVSLYPSKRFFGAARNFENGASLTIVATSLVETGSKMDDVIFEEFKGTGNMEVKLDRRLANKRVFPAINLIESHTRNEELLLDNEKLQMSWKIRRMLESLGDEGNEALIDRLKGTKTNDDFFTTIYQS